MHIWMNQSWTQSTLRHVWAFSITEIRCQKLNMPVNGGYKCSDGSYFNSRCEFFCSPGYSLKGQKTATCQHSKVWSADVPTCVGKTPQHVVLCAQFTLPQCPGACRLQLRSQNLFFTQFLLLYNICWFTYVFEAQWLILGKSSLWTCIFTSTDSYWSVFHQK